MKKIMILAALLVFMTASMSFAAFTKLSTATPGFLTLTGPDLDPIGLSPKCQAYYTTTGSNASDTQWYAISTVHPGGAKAYGTAQDLNNIYIKTHTTNPSQSDLTTILNTIPAIPASPSAWDSWAGTTAE